MIFAALLSILHFFQVVIIVLKMRELSPNLTIMILFAVIYIDTYKQLHIVTSDH